MGLMDIIPTHYIVFTPKVPISPYDLGDGHTLRTVKAKEEMFRGFSYGIPHGYGAVMALNNIGIPSYYAYRDLVFFHAFISDDSEPFDYGETGLDNQQDDSDLTFIENYNSSLKPFSPDRINELDFDRFPLTLFWSTRDLLPSIPETLTPEQIDTLQKRGILFTNPKPKNKIINYRKAFATFRGLKSAGSKDAERLYDLICLYVFVKSMSESRGLYHNDSAVVAFYLAILQSIAGEPAYCEEIHHCDRCNKKDIRHHATGAGREQHMLDRFGYGFKEQTKIRGAFFHDGEFVNISDALFEIHDKIHFEGLRTEANLAQSDSLWEVHESTQRLGTTVRKNLAELFLERYAIR